MPDTAPHDLKILLDTDIGSDVDDAMALSVLLGSPTVQLLGVTTVYGDTVLRARLAKRYASLASTALTVVPGNGKPRSGRQVWWPGHEGSLHPNLDAEPIDIQETAAAFLTRTAAATPGEVDVVAIGPLTNIADAIDADSDFSRNVRRLSIMGGDFGQPEPEHNLRSDAAAAAVVFGSGIPITIVGVDVTRQLKVGGTLQARIATAGPLGTALARDIAQWLEMWGTSWSIPHDPIIALAVTDPQLYTLSQPGWVTITRSGDEEGQSTFTPNPDGNVRVVTDLQQEQILDTIVSRIEHAAARPPLR